MCDAQCQDNATAGTGSAVGKRRAIQSRWRLSSQRLQSVSTFVYRGQGIGLIQFDLFVTQQSRAVRSYVFTKWSSARNPVRFRSVYTRIEISVRGLSVLLNALSGLADSPRDKGLKGWRGLARCGTLATDRVASPREKTGKQRPKRLARISLRSPPDGA